MPQCPHCQTKYEMGQRYCQVCGSFLLHPEEGDTFCPQCDIRVSPRQEFCHECDAPLKGEKAAAPAVEGHPPPAGPAAPAPPTAPAPGMQPWMMGLLVAAGVIIIILLIVLFTRTEKPVPPVPQPPKAEAPTPPAPPPAPPAAAPAPAPAPAAQPATLKEQLQTALAKMREARLNKDIIQLMDCYSLTFPNLEEKRRESLKAWEKYDYTNMVFTIDETQPLDADNANATVTWYVDLKNRKTGELISSTQTFKVRFAKELGQWRIRTLEETE